MKAAAAILLNLIASGLLFAQDYTRFYQDSADLQSARQLLTGGNNSLWMGGFRNLSGENSRAWIYRLNKEGDILSQFRFPGEQEQIYAGMDTLGNGVAAVVGLREQDGTTRYLLAMIQNDSLISLRLIQGLENSVLDDVRPAAGKKLLVCGFRSSPGIAGNDFFIARLRTDSASVDWIFQDSFGSNDHVSMTKELADGSVLFSGTVADQGNNYNPCIGKLDSAGNQLWLNVVDTPWNDGAQKFTLDETGDIWLVGESSTSAGSFFDTEIFRFNSDGQLLWQQWLGSPGQDAAFVIQKKSLTTGFWVAGYSNAGSGGTGPISPFLMSLDSTGNSLGEAFWNLSSPSPAYAMLVEGDSIFYFCGISDNKAFLMRRQNPGLSPVFVVNQKAPIIPDNLSSDPARLIQELETGGISRLSFYDVQGKLLEEISSATALKNYTQKSAGYFILKAEFSDGSIRRQSVLLYGN